MPTTNREECRHNAEICLMLASETTEIYAKTALIELATEFRDAGRTLGAPPAWSIRIKSG